VTLCSDERCPQFADHVDEQIDVRFRRARVDDRGPEGDPSPVRRRSDRDPSVREHRFAQSLVECVQLVVRNAGGVIPDADDIELHVGETLQVVGLINAVRHAPGQSHVAVDHRLRATSTRGATRRLDRAGPRRARALRCQQRIVRLVDATAHVGRGTGSERASEQSFVPHEREPAVMRHVQRYTIRTY